MKDVTFLIPAFNEEKSIGILISNIKNRYPLSEIMVVNNNSSDRTSEIALKLGATVIDEHKQGKGHAVKKGFSNINSKFIIMLDADNTYDPDDAINLIKPLMYDYADVCLGCRLNGKREMGSMSKVNFFGNYVISLTASILYSRIKDVCTGYWALKTEVVNKLLENGIESNGFELEVEMFMDISKAGYKIIEVPICYKTRVDQPKLRSFKDGLRIYKALWYNKVNLFNNEIALSDRDENEILEAERVVYEE